MPRPPSRYRKANVLTVLGIFNALLFGDSLNYHVSIIAAPGTRACP